MSSPKFPKRGVFNGVGGARAVIFCECLYGVQFRGTPDRKLREPRGPSGLERLGGRDSAPLKQPEEALAKSRGCERPRGRLLRHQARYLWQSLWLLGGSLTFTVMSVSVTSTLNTAQCDGRCSADVFNWCTEY